MDGKDLNTIFNGFQRQGFTEANEGGLTHDIGGERGYVCMPALLATLMIRPLRRVSILGSTAWA